MRGIILGIALWTTAAGAHADDKVHRGPAPEWVLAAEPVRSATADDGAAVRLLVQESQANFGADGDTYYARSVVKIQTSQGLSTVGNIAVPWSPDTETLTVHKLSILRGGQEIDVLARQDFTVLRRENRLEYAMLDGQLTASIQPEGLQVGDIVEIVSSVVRREPVFQGRSEQILVGSPLPIDRLLLRAIWTSPKAMRWQATSDLKDVKVARRGATTEVILDQLKVGQWRPQPHAPARFQYGRVIEFSEFASWADLSALLAPLYEKAATLSSTSTLKDEVAKMRAASSDPKVQAGLALALVQDKVRYVFLGMNLGGLTPVDADTTWSRRFGDCKGKTALLLALLKELRIEAQPAAVSMSLGDGVDRRLPAVGAFDHVIVRAKIGGRIYWMDGARTGERSLDALRVPPYRWALPIQRVGAALEALNVLPLETADVMTSLTLDASAGYDAPAAARGEIVMRGDWATQSRLGLGSLSSAEVDRSLREYWRKRLDFIDVQTVASSYDEAKGEQRLTMSGAAKLNWTSSGGRRWYEADFAGLGYDIDFTREPGLYADAPYVVEHPSFERYVETIKLPNGGKDFSVEGENVSTALAGVQFYRQSKIENGAYVVESWSRTLAPEFAASEAASAAEALKKMAKVRVFVRGPADPRAAAQENAKALNSTPVSASDFVDRGNARIDARDYDGALADLERAIALDPRMAVAYADRGIVYSWKMDFARARADFEKAKSLEPDNLVALRGFGLLAMAEGAHDAAVNFFSGAIDHDPSDTFSLEHRARASVLAGRYEGAVADIDKVLALEPGRAGARAIRATALSASGQFDKALADINAAIADAPADTTLLSVRSRIYQLMGRRVDALRDADTVIAKAPSASAYYDRSLLRDRTNTKAISADLEAALRIDANHVPSLIASAKIALADRRYDDAIAASDTLLKRSSTNLLALRTRANAQAAKGQTELALADIAAARAAAPKDASNLNGLCWTQATRGLPLDAALADCAAALAIRPGDAAMLDSRGFVYLKMGRLDEALNDYNAAIAARPQAPTSLFGRGIAKLRKGLIAEGQSDLDAARAVSPNVEAQFADYGLIP